MLANWSGTRVFFDAELAVREANSAKTGDGSCQVPMVFWYVFTHLDREAKNWTFASLLAECR